MKKFSTGTKGRKLEHADNCRTMIAGFSVSKFGSDTLAKEYIGEIDPGHDAEAWAKWQEPELAVVDFQKWLGEDTVAPVLKPMTSVVKPGTPVKKPAITTGSGLLESESLKKELEQARDMLHWSALIIDCLMQGGELPPELQEKLALFKRSVPALR